MGLDACYIQPLLFNRERIKMNEYNHIKYYHGINQLSQKDRQLYCDFLRLKYSVSSTSYFLKKNIPCIAAELNITVRRLKDLLKKFKNLGWAIEHRTKWQLKAKNKINNKLAFHTYTIKRGQKKGVELYAYQKLDITLKNKLNILCNIISLDEKCRQMDYMEANKITRNIVSIKKTVSTNSSVNKAYKLSYKSLAEIFGTSSNNHAKKIIESFPASFIERKEYYCIVEKDVNLQHFNSYYAGRTVKNSRASFRYNAKKKEVYYLPSCQYVLKKDVCHIGLQDFQEIKPTIEIVDESVTDLKTRMHNFIETRKFQLIGADIISSKQIGRKVSSNSYNRILNEVLTSGNNFLKDELAKFISHDEYRLAPKKVSVAIYNESLGYTEYWQRTIQTYQFKKELKSTVKKEKKGKIVIENSDSKVKLQLTDSELKKLLVEASVIQGSKRISERYYNFFIEKKKEEREVLEMNMLYTN